MNIPFDHFPPEPHTPPREELLHQLRMLFIEQRHLRDRFVAISKSRVPQDSILDVTIGLLRTYAEQNQLLRLLAQRTLYEQSRALQATMSWESRQN